MTSLPCYTTLKMMVLLILVLKDTTIKKNLKESTLTTQEQKSEKNAPNKKISFKQTALLFKKRMVPKTALYIRRRTSLGYYSCNTVNVTTVICTQLDLEPAT